MGLLLETRRKGYLLLNTQDLCSGGEWSRYSNKVLRVGKTCVVGPSQHQTVIEGYLSREWKDIFLLLSAHCNLWQMARERKIGLMKSTTQTTDNTLSLLLWGNTDSQWTGRQIWIFWTQLQSHQQAISKASCLACHMLINNNYMKTFSSTISQNPLIYSIVLLCSLNTFPS